MANTQSTDVGVLGTLTATNDTVTCPAGPNAGFALDISGTFSAIVVFEGTIDGTTWTALTGFALAYGFTATQLTSASRVVIPNSGFAAVRARCSSYTSGTVNVVLNQLYSLVQPNILFPIGVIFTETSTAFTANQTFNGAGRNSNATVGSPNLLYSNFRAVVSADQPGNAHIDMSTDGSTWRRATADVAYTATSPALVQCPMVAPWMRVGVVHGATLATFTLVQTHFCQA